jgi:hypothetical protein
MSIRVELTNNLVHRIRSRLKCKDTSDILTVLETAFENHETLSDIHDAVKNGTEYSTIRGNYETPFSAKTSIVDMDDTLYLLTDRLMEIETVISNYSDPRMKVTYHIRSRDWD